jgi:hypothetical protein
VVVLANFVGPNGTLLVGPNGALLSGVPQGTTGTIGTFRESLYQAFYDGWDDLTPLFFENEAHDEELDSWVRFFMRNTFSSQDTLGNSGSRSFAREGAVFVQVFTPLNSGLGESDVYAERVRTILEGVTIGGVHFRGVLTNEIGPTGKWFQVTVEAPFTYYIQK